MKDRKLQEIKENCHYCYFGWQDIEENDCPCFKCLVAFSGKPFKYFSPLILISEEEILP